MNINLIEFFADTIVRNSQKIAIIDGEKSVTFSELDIKSRALAYEIQVCCNCQNQPIALYLPKCTDAVVGDIAITYSGNAYMNLDVKNPAERIKNILSLVKPRAIVTNSMYFEKIREIVSDGFEIITF